MPFKRRVVLIFKILRTESKKNQESKICREVTQHNYSRVTPSIQKRATEIREKPNFLMHFATDRILKRVVDT